MQSSTIIYKSASRQGHVRVKVLALRYIHVQYTRTDSDRLGYATVRLTGSPIARDLKKCTEVFTEGVKCWRIDSIGHKRTRPVSLCFFVSVRLSGSAIARDLEKYTGVFTERVKCRRIDSIGHGRTRPVSLCVGSTERKFDREAIAITEVFLKTTNIMPYLISI